MVVLPFMMIVLLGFGFLLERRKNEKLEHKVREMKLLLQLSRKRRGIS